MEIGTVCIKIAGRDAGKTCVIIEAAKDGRVLVDGQVRRKACNVKHLEPTGKTVKVKTGASHADVMKALGLEPRTSKPRKAAAKPARAKPAPVEEAPKKPVKKAKKEEKKE